MVSSTLMCTATLSNTVYFTLPSTAVTDCLTCGRHLCVFMPCTVNHKSHPLHVALGLRQLSHLPQQTYTLEAVGKQKANAGSFCSNYGTAIQ